uniref:Uncharacterized protein n=1 Tax=Anguilla anguilla TaxID=7936 RepID=A0A0E9PNW5_ANGAN
MVPSCNKLGRCYTFLYGCRGNMFHHLTSMHLVFYFCIFSRNHIHYHVCWLRCTATMIF